MIEHLPNYSYRAVGTALVTSIPRRDEESMGSNDRGVNSLSCLLL